MMTSSNENILRVTGPLCMEFIGHWWITLTEASDTELWYFSLIYAWANGWINYRDAGDLRRHSAHYEVNAMTYTASHYSSNYTSQHMDANNSHLVVFAVNW